MDDCGYAIGSVHVGFSWVVIGNGVGCSCSSPERRLNRNVCALGPLGESRQWLDTVAAGFPTTPGDTEYLGSCRARKIFLQSTHDQFGPRDAIESLYSRIAEPKRLIWVESDDHFFASGLDELEEQVRLAVLQ